MRAGLVALLLALLFLPILAVGLNAFAVDWAGSVLPLGYTTQWISDLIADPRFGQALQNSLILGVGSLVASAVTCVPAILAAHCYYPRLDRWLGGLVVLPYAIPGIVMALGLLKLYAGNYGIVLTGTPWLLIFGYIPLGASLYYVPMKSNLNAIAVQDILEAGYLLGIGDLKLQWRVILPCVRQGVVIGLILNFTLVISEFVYANLLVGGLFPTLQIFMYVLRGGSGHLLSVLIMVYFGVVLVATTLVSLILMQRKEAR
jgi:putative spermidine/putrescine transport system permease protein